MRKRAFTCFGVVGETGAFKCVMSRPASLEGSLFSGLVVVDFGTVSNHPGVPIHFVKRGLGGGHPLFKIVNMIYKCILRAWNKLDVVYVGLFRL